MPWHTRLTASLSTSSATPHRWCIPCARRCHVCHELQSLRAPPSTGLQRHHDKSEPFRIEPRVACAHCGRFSSFFCCHATPRMATDGCAPGWVRVIRGPRPPSEKWPVAHRACFCGAVGVQGSSRSSTKSSNASPQVFQPRRSPEVVVAILAQAILAQVKLKSLRWFAVDGQSWRFLMIGCKCCGDLDRQR